MEMTIGPIQLILVGFEKGQFEEEIFRQLESLRNAGDVRLIDMLFIHKTLEGSVFRLDLSDLGPEVALRYGSIAEELIGLESGVEEISPRATGERMLEMAHTYGLSQSDLRNIPDRIPNGSSAAIVLVEHLWILRLNESLQELGGSLVAQGLVKPISLGTIKARIAPPAEASD